ncbi:carbonic anhydrase family protein [Kiritimatiellota bacterium B12222]|nr:carbonic anhydrase family protein [Kiritimatiellota bacterium B12222]
MKNTVAFLLFCFLMSSSLLRAQITRAEQEMLTPDDVIADLMAGNEKYITGKLTDGDIVSRIEASATGQHPKAVILSCLDSRVPVELVFNQGIGDVFVGRVAGNIENGDQLGSMEFATKLSRAKLVMVLGHERCGAISGAINEVQLGNLTALLEKIRPAIETVEGFEVEDRVSANAAFVKAVTQQNVRLTVENIRKGSPVLAELEKSGEIKIIGAMYDVQTGRVSLLD